LLTLCRELAHAERSRGCQELFERKRASRHGTGLLKELSINPSGVEKMALLTKIQNEKYENVYDGDKGLEDF
jgi:hypothetical protein